MLHFLCLVFFSCCPFLCYAIFCCTLAKLHYFHVALFSMLKFFVLHSLHVALFSCFTICCVAHFWGCNFSALHFFHLVLLSCFTFLRVALFSSCTFFMLHLVSFWFMLHSLHDALFCVVLISCCNFSTLHSFILNSFQVAFSSCCTFFFAAFFLCFFHDFDSCWTHFLLYFFRVLLISCFIFSVFALFNSCSLFILGDFSSCTFLALDSFRIALFFVFQSFDIGHFSWCTVTLFWCIILLVLFFENTIKVVEKCPILEKTKCSRKCPG